MKNYSTRKWLAIGAIGAVIGLATSLIPIYYPQCSTTAIIYIIAILMLISIPILVIINWKKNQEEPTFMFNYIFPDKFKKYGVAIFLVLIFSILFLAPFVIKRINSGFLTEKIEKEIIIKKFDSVGKLIEQKSYT